MNSEVFSVLTRAVGKLREMKKTHEEMAAELAQMKAEKEQECSKYLSHFSILLKFFLQPFCFVSFPFFVHSQ